MERLANRLIRFMQKRKITTLESAGVSYWNGKAYMVVFHVQPVPESFWEDGKNLEGLH